MSKLLVLKSLSSSASSQYSYHVSAFVGSDTGIFSQSLSNDSNVLMYSDNVISQFRLHCTFQALSFHTVSEGAIFCHQTR